jgi:hypothetical protein
MLSEENRKACLKKLAERLGREVPDLVAQNLRDDSMYLAYYVDDEDAWAQLEGEARPLLRVNDGASASGSLPPGRDGDRAAPTEIAVELSEVSLERARAFSEVAAALADNHPEVKRFRWTHLRYPYLRDRLLTDQEARAFLDEQGGPYGTGWVLEKLLRIANERLVKTYHWREGDAVWFMLTGYVPPVRPFEVGGYISPTIKNAGRPRKRIPNLYPPRYIAAVPKAKEFHPSTAQITVTAEVWVDAREVERAFRDAQRQILGGDTRGRDDRTLAAVTFVARRMREHGKESWRERWEAWHQTCRKEWRYASYRGLRQAFERFAYPEYRLSNYQLREKTPYEAYSLEWEERHARESQP